MQVRTWQSTIDQPEWNLTQVTMQSSIYVHAILNFTVLQEIRPSHPVHTDDTGDCANPHYTGQV